MHLQPFNAVALVLAGLSAASWASYPGASNDLNARRITFRSQVQKDTNLRYVANSGVCETTPGVDQYSGYIDIGTNMSMWFWFFEARHSPETAPFTLWLNGGPGCSSMIGLFQENGPCRVNKDNTTTYLNPYSWNNVSNVIYIDQPIGTGFSYGTVTVDSTPTAAPFVWKAFQVLFESKLFSKYASREFIFTTESYGGHYAPSFVTYFDQQNALIASGALKAEPVVVSAIMINNGLYDPLIQDIAFYKFAKNAPGYGQLQPDDVLKKISDALYAPNGCVALEKKCYDAGNSIASNSICNQADNYCTNNVYQPAVKGRNPYDLRQTTFAYPPEYYMNYLRLPEVMKQIGAEVTYQECSQAPFAMFNNTGDEARTWLPELGKLVDSRLRVLIWAGDADIICNWIGGYDCMLAMDWYGNAKFHNTPLTNITLNGTPIAAVANVDNFSFARVYASGHEVPAFQPAAALAIFTQVIDKEQLHSV